MNTAITGYGRPGTLGLVMLALLLVAPLSLAGTFGPPGPFVLNGDGTVTDIQTGLMWSRDANVMASRDPGFDQDYVLRDGGVTWQHALDYIARLNAEGYLGYSDWRLPSVADLETLVNTEATPQDGLVYDEKVNQLSVLPIHSYADLAVSMTASAPMLHFGETLVYTITVTNRGPGGGGASAGDGGGGGERETCLTPPTFGGGDP